MKASPPILFGILLLAAGMAGAVDSKDVFKQGIDAASRGDFATAVALFRPLAEHGDAWAQVNLGWLYGQGHGVPKDFAKSAIWFEKAAAQGNPDIQYEVGVDFFFGMMVAKDQSQAAVWLRKSAEQGKRKSQFMLGWMYEDGLGVPVDFAQALAWHRKAGAQGDTGSLFNLGRFYEFGKGVRKDFVAAYALYNMAISMPNLDGTFADPQGLAKDKEVRQGLVADMTPLQIDAGEALTREMRRVGVLKALEARK